MGTVNSNGRHGNERQRGQTPRPSPPHPPPPSSSSSSPTSDHRQPYPRSLPLLLLRIFQKDGMRGLYKGCSLQLIHKVLKSALLMMVRERITSASRRFFLA